MAEMLGLRGGGSKLLATNAEDGSCAVQCISLAFHALPSATTPKRRYSNVRWAASESPQQGTLPWQAKVRSPGSTRGPAAAAAGIDKYGEKDPPASYHATAIEAARAADAMIVQRNWHLDNMVSWRASLVR